MVDESDKPVRVPKVYPKVEKPVRVPKVYPAKVEKKVDVKKVVEVVEKEEPWLTRAEIKGLLSHLPTWSERPQIETARDKLLAALK